MKGAKALLLLFLLRLSVKIKIGSNNRSCCLGGTIARSDGYVRAGSYTKLLTAVSRDAKKFVQLLTPNDNPELCHPGRGFLLLVPEP